MICTWHSLVPLHKREKIMDRIREYHQINQYCRNENLNSDYFWSQVNERSKRKKKKYFIKKK